LFIMGLPACRGCAFGALLAVAAVSGAAEAADLVPGLAPIRGYSWQGPYVGANLGYLWGTTTNNPTQPSGVSGGLQVGYNLQGGPIVAGIEADLQLSGAEDRFAPWKFSNPWFGTLRGRVGYATGNLLFYGTVGLAYGALTAENTLTGVSQSGTGAGWAAGGGVEFGLTADWSARAEYLYVDLGNQPFGVTGANNGLAAHLLRLGVNFRF
jgi:outer membrane immunogenic protein